MTAREASGTWRVETNERRGLRSNLAAAALGGLVLAAGIWTSFAVHRYAARKSLDGSGWRGKVVQVTESGPTGADGLVVTGPESGGPARPGADLPAGAHVTTDPYTRARVRFDDGSELVMDRSTDLATLSSAKALRLASGQLAIEVPAFADPAERAHIRTSEGEVTVTGARLLVTATADRTSIEVVRGAARVVTPLGQVEIGPGEQAVARRGAAPIASGAADLARRASFSESLGDGAGAARAPTFSGIGELVARRPGKAEDKDHALHLSTHAATIRVAANVARTEVLEEFTNDTGDDLEGIYRFPLPAGAQIESLSLDVDGRMVPGSFVEKGKAASIWRGAIHNAAPKAPKPVEEIVWVPGPWRDPALLEWNGAGRFELRIFPIPKHASRRILIGYTEVVPSDSGTRRYVYALPERDAKTPAIDRFSIDVQVRGAEPVRAHGYDLTRAASAESGAQRLSFSAEAFRPTGDLSLEFSLDGDQRADVTAWAYREPSPPPDKDATNGSSSDAFVALALRPRLPRWEHPSFRDHVLIVDAGHSMTGERFRKAAALASEIAREMDRRDRVTVLSCDVTCRHVPEGWLEPGAPASRAIEAFLASVAPDGATDLVGAVREAAAIPGRAPANDLRVIVLSSGYGGAGYRGPGRTSSEVASALEDARAEVVTVPVGADADASVLREIARGGGGVVVPDSTGRAPAAVALDVLEATYGALLRDATLTLPEGLYGATAELGAIRAGEERIATLRMRGEHVQGTAILRGRVAGQPFEARYPLDVRASSEPGNAFVPRLYAEERVATLERTGGDAARPEVVALSQRFAVPSRFTSLLVLESEAMFQAFGIDRTRNAQVFTGENEAVASFASTPVAPADELPNAPAKVAAGAPGAFGYGGAASARTDDLSGDVATGDTRRAAAKAAQAPAEWAPPPPPAVPGTRSAASAVAAPSATANADPVPEVPRRAVGRWMRREWFRAANITGPKAPASRQTIDRARAALALAPDDRAKYKDLAKWLALDASLTELEEVLSRWAARDPFDPDVVVARADVLARGARRDEGLRVLSGVVGGLRALTAKDELGLERSLAKAYERSGKPQACAFWIRAAELSPLDFDLVAHAVACERGAGRRTSADRWLASLDDASRVKAERVAAALESPSPAQDASSERATWGDLVIDASWDAGVDLDIVVIDPSGSRQAWSSRSGSLRVSDPRSTKHEAVALTSYASGPFMIEVVRTDGVDGANPIHGRVRVRALGGHDTSNEGAVDARDFVLTGSRAEVARVDVRWDSRLVPTSGPVL